MVQTVKSLPAMQETRVRSLDQEDPLEKEMATRSSIFAWRIPQTEELGRLQSMGSQRFELLNLSFQKKKPVLYPLFSSFTPPSPKFPSCQVAAEKQRHPARGVPMSPAPKLGSGRVQMRTQLHRTTAHRLPPNQLPRQLAFLKPNLISYLGVLSLFQLLQT